MLLLEYKLHYIPMIYYGAFQTIHKECKYKRIVLYLDLTSKEYKQGIWEPYIMAPKCFVLYCCIFYFYYSYNQLIGELLKAWAEIINQQLPSGPICSNHH